VCPLVVQMAVSAAQELLWMAALWKLISWRQLPLLAEAV